MKCPACSATLPADARYCIACGRPVTSETGPVSVAFSRVEPHWFGVTPPTFLFGVAVAMVVVAGVLFANGSIAFGLIFLGIGALGLAFFVEIARRQRNSVLTRVTADVRERAGITWESLRVRSSVAVESHRVRGELAAIQTQRRDALLALGEATHGSDKEAGAKAEKLLTELDERETDLQAQLQTQVEEAGERIRQVKLSVDKTVVAPPKE